MTKPKKNMIKSKHIEMTELTHIRDAKTKFKYRLMESGMEEREAEEKSLEVALRNDKRRESGEDQTKNSK